MPGGIIQISCPGPEDLYLTGNPQITFFKTIYRRHTNFAVETVEHQFTNQPDFGKKFSLKIPKDGDLLSKIYIRVVLDCVNPDKSNFAWTRRLGHAILKSAEIEIGGSKIDEQSGIWLDIWYELARQGFHDRGYSKLIGDIQELTEYNNSKKNKYILYIPLQFWFNRHIGLAFPLIALRYHDININIEFEKPENLIIHNGIFNPNTLHILNSSLLVNYIYLDSEERQRFALVGHEYLIEQVQTNIQPVLYSFNRYNLDFNHNIKEIIFAMRNGNYISGKKFVYYSNQDTWDINQAAYLIIEKSISIGLDPTPLVGGTWQPVPPDNYMSIGSFNIYNQNPQLVYINNESLCLGNYILTNKIFADILICQNNILCEDINTSLTIRDLSISTEYMVDTRFNPDDPKINIFSNYGLYLDGSENPIQSVQIQFNGYDRFEKMDGFFFNYIQPEIHHTNIPKDGINIYSFALYPEQHQPSGSANFSRIQNKQLILLFGGDSQLDCPDINLFNPENKLYILDYPIIYCGL